MPEIEDVQGLKRVASPLLTKPVGQNGPYFGGGSLVGFY